MKPTTDYLDHGTVEELQNINDQLLSVNRCAATMKGGRRFSFAALVVTGDRSGHVGYGFSKARQVPNAIEKAGKDGRKHMQIVPVTKDGSIPHEVVGEYCAARVKLIPASSGTGIIAGASVRAVAEMAGIHNLLTKSLGSTNPVNLVKATLHALSQLRTPEEVAELRGVEL